MAIGLNKLKWSSLSIGSADASEILITITRYSILI